MIDRPARDETAGSGGRGEEVVADVRRRGATFWLSAIAGWSVIAWGLRGIFRHHLDTQPERLGWFFLEGALLHDLVLAPIVLGLGLVVARVTPPAWRARVQALLLVCGCLALFSYPEVRGYANIGHNPTSLPYNYAVNLAVSAGTVVAVMVAVTGAWRVRSRGRHSAK